MPVDENESEVTNGIVQEFIDAVMFEAQRDACRAGEFVKSLGILPDAGGRIGLPENFMLRVGFAMRLAQWEANGDMFHRNAGLPSADEVLDEAFRNPTADPAPLATALLRMTMERFAWFSPLSVGADIALSEFADDQLFDCLAEFLWNNRDAN